jgi:hypothetical protein
MPRRRYQSIVSQRPRLLRGASVLHVTFPCSGRSSILTPFIVWSDSSGRRLDPGRLDIPEKHRNEIYRQ